MSKVLFNTEKGEAGTWSLVQCQDWGGEGVVFWFFVVFFVREICYSFYLTVYTYSVRTKKNLKESHKWLLMS